ncbi:MAG: AraC family transcriptional regulator [Pseudomonadota bacterium]
MSAPSKWPLPRSGERLLTPAFMLNILSEHPLTRECYPTAMGYYPDARGHRMLRRQHDDNLLIYCVSGRGRAQVGEWRGEVFSGQVLNLPRGVPHQYQADDGRPWSIYWVHYRGSATDSFTHFLGARSSAAMLMDIGISPRLVAHFQSLLAVQRTGYSNRAFINAANQLRHLLTEIALQQREFDASNQRSFDLEAVQRFMRENIDQSIDLNTLASAAKLSKYHFTSKYKALTGYSPIRHFLNMKMEHACQLLDTSQLSIKAIANGLGYDDPLYFSRLFKKTVGMSPRLYRRSVRL